MAVSAPANAPAAAAAVDAAVVVGTAAVNSDADAIGELQKMPTARAGAAGAKQDQTQDSG